MFWPGVTPPTMDASAAIDSGMREQTPDRAAAEAHRLCELLRGADIAFKKIDSLIRGPTLAEIAVCVRAGFWRSCVLAPAFPFQQRLTRGGRQYARLNGEWTLVSADLAAELRNLGVPARRSASGADLQPDVNVCDAETDDDLRAIVSHTTQSAEPVLWIGTGGLAQAMAHDHCQPATHPLPRPVLGLFGSDQPATADQLAAWPEHRVEIEADAFDDVIGRLVAPGLVLVSFRLAAGLSRTAAAARIATSIEALVARIDPPGTIVVAGGETLRSLCDATDARSLLVTGRLMPGVPLSIIQGGRWNGVTVVSKSGAFGPPDLLSNLLLNQEPTP